MKISIGRVEPKGVELSELVNGTPFTFCPFKVNGNRAEQAVHIKTQMIRDGVDDMVAFCINLDTGNIDYADQDTIVYPVNAEVIVYE